MTGVAPASGKVLVADIGATNARFAVADTGGKIHDLASLPCRQFAGPQEAVRAYLGRTGNIGFVAACFAVAGPADGDAVALTNNHWRFSVVALREALGLERLLVVNDLEALARGVPSLPPEHLAAIGAGPGVDSAESGPDSGPDPAESSAVRAVVGPGTGLGVSTLVPIDGGWRALAAEGGYVSLSPITDWEVELWRIIRARHGRVSAERVLSGPGLIELYAAVCEARGHALVLSSSAAITGAALDGSCDDCVETLARFCAFLGGVAGDVALTVGARGGVYLGGGIVPRILDFLRASEFRRRFDAKGRMTQYVSRIPVFAIVAPVSPALAGAVAMLRD